MIHHFSKTDISSILALLSGKEFTLIVHRDLHKGVKAGVVNFRLVCFKGNYLIERTYSPSSSWKSARKRYVSLDSYLSEVRSLQIADSFIDDLPF